MKKLISTLLLLCAVSSVMAQDIPQTEKSLTTAKKKRTHRIDREINSNKFVFKGESYAYSRVFDFETDTAWVEIKDKDGNLVYGKGVEAQ